MATKKAQTKKYRHPPEAAPPLYHAVIPPPPMIPPPPDTRPPAHLDEYGITILEPPLSPLPPPNYEPSCCLNVEGRNYETRNTTNYHEERNYEGLLLWSGTRLMLDNGIDWMPIPQGSDMIPGYEEESETPNGETIALHTAFFDQDIKEYEEAMNYESENDTQNDWCDDEWNTHHNLSMRTLGLKNTDWEDDYFPPVKKQAIGYG